ncbi:MAG: hypothetical protein ACXVHV_11495 [Methanobacterium sp.]
MFGRKFIAKVNAAWWNTVAKKAEENIPDQKDGTFALLWSKQLKMHFMMYNTHSQKGHFKRKAVLTNAFINKSQERINGGKKQHIVKFSH